MAAVNFLVLLAKQRWEALRENVGRYPRMEVLFGGPHQSLPSPGRFGVSAGDLVYTVFASGGDLHVMCRSVVREVVPIRRYFVERLGVAESELTTPLWGTIRALQERGLPQVAHLWSDECLEDAAVCESSPLRFDARVGPEELAGLRFWSRRGGGGERPIKYVVEGKLRNTVSIQNGYFRLTEGSARVLAGVAVS